MGAPRKIGVSGNSSALGSAPLRMWREQSKRGRGPWRPQGPVGEGDAGRSWGKGSPSEGVSPHCADKTPPHPPEPKTRVRRRELRLNDTTMGR